MYYKALTLSEIIIEAILGLDRGIMRHMNSDNFESANSMLLFFEARQIASFIFTFYGE